jgi:hypothetical protein
VKKIDGCECYPIGYILHNDPDEFMPEWVKACLDNGSLVIMEEVGEEGPWKWLNVKLPRKAYNGPAPNSGYVVRDEVDWINVLSALQFDEMYDIID